MRGVWILRDEDPQLPWQCDGDRWDRTNRIELGRLRHLIEHQQQALALPDGPTITLRWQARTGGTFGPQSSAEANRRSRGPQRTPGPAPSLDRGASVAWHVAFACPLCDRSCRILWNPLWHWRRLGLTEEQIANGWQCQSCEASPCRYKWPSQRWTGTSSGARRQRPASHQYQRHHHAVQRCLELMETPSRLSTDRWMALHRLRRAHGLLAMAAVGGAWPMAAPELVSTEALTEAMATIEANRWALRQASWHRNGKPRPGPAARAKAGCC